MAVTYRFRCPIDGDFLVEQSIKETTPQHWCPECGGLCPKVLSAHIFFPYGRSTFSNGPEGTGETVRETQRRWLKEATDAGLQPEGVGYRHI